MVRAWTRYFFFASKAIGLLARADIWILVLAGAMLLAAAAGRRRASRRLAFVNIVYIAGLGFMPIGNVLIAPLERAHQPANVFGQLDGIIVLGGGEDRLATRRWGQLQINAAGKRLSSAAGLSRKFPQARIVLSGGQGKIGHRGEDQRPFYLVAREFFVGLGVDSDLIVVESQSRNTAENAHMSYALVQPKPGERWALVTSAFHMSRALRSFERAGWTGVQPYPVDYRSHAPGVQIGWNLAENLDTANVALKEWVGLLVYGVSGR